ncbi:hypothetical protein LOF24_21580 [Sinorhizobium meliloti SM11]|uniref:hypothetical protein n=1 Tax=Rhizobium meliloti TaxID=382 RepID=UPI00165180E5|nr:hypothetical protein [Sinorhizobium meliloti]MDE4560650.1 hypothetical protein [Sinorhizobium meliloti SM11]
MLTLAKKQRKMFYPQNHSGLRLLEVRADGRFAEGKVITQLEYRGRTRGQRPGVLSPGCARTIFKQDAKDQGRTRAASLEKGQTPSG